MQKGTLIILLLLLNMCSFAQRYTYSFNLSFTDYKEFWIGELYYGDTVAIKFDSQARKKKNRVFRVLDTTNVFLLFDEGEKHIIRDSIRMDKDGVYTLYYIHNHRGLIGKG